MGGQSTGCLPNTPDAAVKAWSDGVRCPAFPWHPSASGRCGQAQGGLPDMGGLWCGSTRKPCSVTRTECGRLVASCLGTHLVVVFSHATGHG